MATYRPLLNPPTDTPSAAARREPPRPTYRARYPNRTWWTRERVVAALRRWHRDHGTAPTSTEEWNELTKGVGGRAPQDRPYPSFYGVLRYFRSFREAWTAAGVDVDRIHQEWTALEDWYLREAAGLVPRDEIARDLKRSPDAVHRRLYDLGIHSYQQQGWTLSRIAAATGLTMHTLRNGYVRRGRLPFAVGTKCYYLDPADLVAIREIDWSAVTPELEHAVRRALVGRIVATLEGHPAARETDGAASLARYRMQPLQGWRDRIEQALAERGFESVRVAAARLGVAPVTLNRWIALGRVPAERVAVGGRVVNGVPRDWREE